MEEKKGLADAQEGEFTLNESGTTVSTDPVEGIDAPAAELVKEDEIDKEQNTGKTRNDKNVND